MGRTPSGLHSALRAGRLQDTHGVAQAVKAQLGHLAEQRVGQDRPRRCHGHPVMGIQQRRRARQNAAFLDIEVATVVLDEGGCRGLERNAWRDACR